MEKMKSNFWHFIASIMPNKIIYYCAIRLTAYATTGQYENQIVPDLTMMDALKRFGDDHNI